MTIYGNAFHGNLPKHWAHNVRHVTYQTAFIYIQIKYRQNGISIQVNVVTSLDGADWAVGDQRQMSYRKLKFPL
jgi:hypothetical protein